MDFAIRLFVSFFLGVGIGIERQWLRTRAILKTNVLVTVGAAMFVMLSIMTPGDASPTRISAQIVSGVGFLGGGVILREGASVKGTNTAATLWCAAAVGTLVGSGYLVQAYLGTFAVVSAHLLLKPLVEAFRHQEDNANYQGTTDLIWNEQKEPKVLNNSDRSKSVETFDFSDFSDDNTQRESYSKSSPRIASERRGNYRCRVTCSPENQTRVLTLLLQLLKEQNWHLKRLDSRNIFQNNNSQEVEMVEIKVDFLTDNADCEPECLEKIVNSLKADSLVNSIGWQFSI